MISAVPLETVNLMLDALLVERLERESERRVVSLSELVGTLLTRQLEAAAPPSASLERIRRLRASFGPMPDSGRIVREDRDGGW